jgi:prophage regulatory protein
MELRIIRRPALISRYGRSRSSIYADIKAGLWPAPISLGARCVGWPQHECDAILAARIAGRTDHEIRALVARLKEERQRIEAAPWRRCHEIKETKGHHSGDRVNGDSEDANGLRGAP